MDVGSSAGLLRPPDERRRPQRQGGIERKADHARELDLAVGLGEQKDSGVKASVMDDGVLGIAGRKQDPERRASLGDLVGKLTTIHGPGMITSVNRRSNLAPLSTILSASDALAAGIVW